MLSGGFREGLTFKVIDLPMQLAIDCFAANDLFVRDRGKSFNQYVKTCGYRGSRFGAGQHSRWDPTGMAVYQNDLVVGGIYFRKRHFNELVTLDYVVIDPGASDRERIRKTCIEFFFEIQAEFQWEEVYTMVCSEDTKTADFLAQFGFAEVKLLLNRTKGGSEVRAFVRRSC